MNALFDLKVENSFLKVQLPDLDLTSKFEKNIEQSQKNIWKKIYINVLNL